MNKPYIDQNLIQNTTLACFLLTSFVRDYEKRTAGTASPDVLKLLLVLPFVWHRTSRDAIKSRAFSTPIQAVLADCPSIKYEFQQRVAAFAPVSLQGINLACATGLLGKSESQSNPIISSMSDQWPRGSKPSGTPPDMVHAVERLSNWFKDASTIELFSHLLGS